MSRRPHGDRGSAVVAAVFAAAAFALLADQIVHTSRSALQSASAEEARGQLEADAEAGLAIAVDGLTAADSAKRWGLADGPHSTVFNGANLEIRVEDERGKISLNTITEAQLQKLFDKAGAPAPAVPDLVAAFLNFRDPGRLNGAAADAGAGGFVSVEQLAQVPGMTPALYAAIVPAVTVSNGNAPFDPRYAAPLALEVMAQGPGGEVAAIERSRELAGERPALSGSDEEALVGRAVTVRVTARDADGGLEKTAILEFTGRPDHPYVVRKQTDSSPAA